MRPAVIQEQEVQAVGKGLGKGLPQEMKGTGIQIRSCKKETLPRGRGHGPIDREPVADVLDRPHGSGPARRAPSAVRGPQAAAPFVLTTYPHRAGILQWDDELQPLLTGRLKRPDGLRGFGCDWAAAP
jgi:hypothetical protein